MAEATYGDSGGKLALLFEGDATLDHVARIVQEVDEGYKACALVFVPEDAVWTLESPRVTITSGSVLMDLMVEPGTLAASVLATLGAILKTIRMVATTREKIILEKVEIARKIHEVLAEIKKDEYRPEEISHAVGKLAPVAVRDVVIGDDARQMHASESNLSDEIDLGPDMLRSPPLPDISFGRPEDAIPHRGSFPHIRRPGENLGDDGPRNPGVGGGDVGV
jgi:hypothetical protein